MTRLRLGILGGLCVALQTGRAQTPARDSSVRRAAIAGTVRDTADRPIQYATVHVDGRDLTAVSDTAGRFHLAGDIAGPGKFTVLRFGYAAFTFQATLPPDTTIVVAIRMRAAQTLPDVNVRGQRESASLARGGFYERQRAGWGQYLTPEQVEKLSHLMQPSQMLRDMRGIRVRCPPVGPCRVTGTANACMSLFVDGHYVRDTMDSRVSTGMVYALEVYSSPGTVPGSFNRPMAEGRCGAIVVWTISRKP